HRTGLKTCPYDFLKRLYLNILFSNTSIMFISFVLIQVKRTRENIKSLCRHGGIEKKHNYKRIVFMVTVYMFHSKKQIIHLRRIG
ncbi:MAG: hypothetical protein J7K51_00050, partial [Thermotogae bacterium]|nr:hypothetical protein [Thermotogota bacterium]